MEKGPIKDRYRSTDLASLCNIEARQMPGGARRRGTGRLEAGGRMEGPSGSFATEHLWP